MAAINKPGKIGNVKPGIAPKSPPDMLFQVAAVSDPELFGSFLACSDGTASGPIVSAATTVLANKLSSVGITGPTIIPACVDLGDHLEVRIGIWIEPVSDPQGTLLALPPLELPGGAFPFRLNIGSDCLLEIAFHVVQNFWNLPLEFPGVSLAFPTPGTVNLLLSCEIPVLAVGTVDFTIGISTAIALAENETLAGGCTWSPSVLEITVVPIFNPDNIPAKVLDAATNGGQTLKGSITDLLNSSKVQGVIADIAQALPQALILLPPPPAAGATAQPTLEIVFLYDSVSTDPDTGISISGRYTLPSPRLPFVTIQGPTSVGSVEGGRPVAHPYVYCAQVGDLWGSAWVYPQDPDHPPAGWTGPPAQIQPLAFAWSSDQATVLSPKQPSTEVIFGGKTVETTCRLSIAVTEPVTGLAANDTMVISVTTIPLPAGGDQQTATTTSTTAID